MKYILAFLVITTISGCYEDKMRKEMEMIGCKYSHTEELKERVYCGKACFRPKKREYYTCKDGGASFFEY